MKAGVRVALAVGAGYLLGRSKKMRLALMIAAAGATGRVGTSPGKLVQNGLKQLGATAEVGKLTDLARDELVGAAKSAAVAAASNRIESLNERLQSGGGVRNPLQEKDERAEEQEESDAPAESEEDQGEEDQEQARGNDDDDETPENSTRRRTATRRTSRSAGDEGSTRRTRASSGRSPVRRAGR
ncbi:hypothetical protein [Amycolatopsis sp. GM8]|uniref:hypothetical protein n=1 Tax=Amycolatopsis sp. GM8 TaxID=2896530 RepID=UPI001F158EA6|nr:hypothetical protein [Amycolatopsis sp. GM8]